MYDDHPVPVNRTLQKQCNVVVCVGCDSKVRPFCYWLTGRVMPFDIMLAAGEGVGLECIVVIVAWQNLSYMNVHPVVTGGALQLLHISTHWRTRLI